MINEEQILTTWIQSFLASFGSPQPEAEAERTAPAAVPVVESTATPSPVFSTRPTPRVPADSAVPQIGHPLLCREMPSEVSTVSPEDFTADFNCRLEVIRDHITHGRLDQAAPLIDGLNDIWRRFNSAHREIPQGERSALLGQLYLAQAGLERARGPHRAAYAAHYEARGHDLMGDFQRARLGYREFLSVSDGTADRCVIAYRGVSSDRQRALEIDAVDRLSGVAHSILEQRERHLVRDGLDGMRAFDASTVFLGGLRSLIESGRAATVDEAVAVLREDHLTSRREFVADPVIPADRRVHGWPELTAVRLEGGTFELRTAASSPRSMTVTVGRAGGVICLPEGQYYFPPSDRELTVRLHGDRMAMLVTDDGGRIPDVRSGGEFIRLNHGYYESSPPRGDAGIPAEVLAMRLAPHAVYDASGEEVHPNSLEGVFDPLGNLRADGFLDPMLEMETQEGLERITDGETRADYLIEIATRMRSHDGSYGVAASCLEAVFSDQFDRAIAYVGEHRSEEIEALRAHSATDEDFQAGLSTLVSEQMERWSVSGESAALDPVAARAWAIYNDMLDPTNEYFNMADESQDAMVDEVIITGITFVSTLGLGSAVSESVEGTRIVRLAAAASSVGSRRLLMRFGPRIASLGARAAYGVVRGSAAVAVRATAVDTPILYEGSSILSGQRPTTDGALHTWATMAVFHGVGGVYGGGATMTLGRTAMGRSVTTWVGDSALRRFAVRGTVRTGALGTMTTAATALSDPSEGTLAERFTVEGGRMLYMTALGMPFEPSAPGARRSIPARSTPSPRLESLPGLESLTGLTDNPEAISQIREEVREEMGGRYESGAEIRDAVNTVLRRHGIDSDQILDRLQRRAEARELTLEDYHRLARLVSDIGFQFFPDEVPVYRATAPEHAGLPGRSRRGGGSDWGVGETEGAQRAMSYFREGMALIRSTFGALRGAGADFRVEGSGGAIVSHPEGRAMPFEVVDAAGTPREVVTAVTGEVRRPVAGDTSSAPAERGHAASLDDMDASLGRLAARAGEQRRQTLEIGESIQRFTDFLSEALGSEFPDAVEGLEGPRRRSEPRFRDFRERISAYRDHLRSLRERFDRTVSELREAEASGYRELAGEIEGRLRDEFSRELNGVIEWWNERMLLAGGMRGRTCRPLEMALVGAAREYVEQTGYRGTSASILWETTGASTVMDGYSTSRGGGDFSGPIAARSLEVTVIDPLAERLALEAIEARPEVSEIRDLGDGRYEAELSGGATIEVTMNRSVTYGLDLGRPQMEALDSWFASRPLSAESRTDVAAYDDATFSSFIRHLRSARWERSQVEGYVLHFDGSEGMRLRLEDIYSRPLEDAAESATGR